MPNLNNEAVCVIPDISNEAICILENMRVMFAEQLEMFGKSDYEIKIAKYRIVEAKPWGIAVNRMAEQCNTSGGMAQLFQTDSEDGNNILNRRMTDFFAPRESPYNYDNLADW